MTLRALLVTSLLGVCIASRAQALELPSSSWVDAALGVDLSLARPAGPSATLLERSGMTRLAVRETKLVGPLALDQGSGSGNEATAVLALILGIIPGFGIGHLVAGSSNWTTWLLIDLVLIAVLIVLWILPGPGIFTTLAYLAIFIERIFEGVFAFMAATGRRGFASEGLLPERPVARQLSETFEVFKWSF